ncbi:MAG: hypothetical protein KDI30_06430 [Pseudomonadales bacterium]|nr:hypothetical protein [Pseudomonadales bacterium]
MKRFLRICFDWFLVVPLLSVFLLEVVLQIGALVIDKRQMEPASWMNGSATRVVMMGDSNTYGIYLDEAESYPARLAEKWNNQNPDHQIEVINLGFPGVNSSRILKNLPEVLKMFKPDLVTVMVGVNDFWTAPVDVEGVENRLSPVEKFFRDYSRVYKLVYMLERELYNPQDLKIDQQARKLDFSAEQNERFVELINSEDVQLENQDMPNAVSYGDVDFSIGYVFEPQQAAPAKSLGKNLKLMADICQQYGVDLVFLTYPYYEGVQKVANRQMKQVAKQQGVSLINVAAAFRRLCAGASENCPDYFFPDFHPLATGYDKVADVLVNALPIDKGESQPADTAVQNEEG